MFIKSKIHTVRNAVRNRRFVASTPAVARGLIAPARRILCNPHDLRGNMLLGKIFAANGYRVVSDSRERHQFSVKQQSGMTRFNVNGRHKNNLKKTVAQQWYQAIGREVEVDPRQHHGPMVEKSDVNATHDGRIVLGPLSASEINEKKVYQRLVDNASGEEIIDLRVTFHGSELPLVYEKRRPKSTRFSNTNSSVRIVEPSAVFSDAEISELLTFADLAGLDFGEADVLRDNASGLIWVVDSTQGPAGPPNGLPPADGLVAVRRLAAAFDRMLEAANSER